MDFKDIDFADMNEGDRPEHRPQKEPNKITKSNEVALIIAGGLGLALIFPYAEEMYKAKQELPNVRYELT
ncbi:MAG: hypothetical protein ACRCYJ_07790 [Plesiomonas shigelloides]